MPKKGIKGSRESIVISALLSLQDAATGIILGLPEKILLTVGKAIYKSLAKGETPEKILRSAAEKAVGEWKPRLKDADRANLVSGLVSAVGEIGGGTSIADMLEMFEKIKKEATIKPGKEDVRIIISVTTRNGYTLSEDQAKEVYPLILKNLIEISRKYQNAVSNEELMRVLYHNLIFVKDSLGMIFSFNKEEIRKIEDIAESIKTGHKEIADGIDNLRSLALAEKEFEPLSGKILPEQDLGDAFIYGKEGNWTDIILDRDIERDCYQQLFQSVCSAFDDEKGLSVLFPVRGEMGSGKSTVLKRLSYDLYCQGKYVVFYRNLKHSLGLNLSGDIKALIETARQRSIKKYFIVIDNAQHLEMGDFSGCLENMTKMKPEERAVVIMSARPEGWRKLSPETATGGNISWRKNKKGNYWEIENTTEDRIRLAENLRDHSIIDDEALVAAKLLASESLIADSLLVFLIIITLKGPEGSGHIDRILNQFRELSPEERFAYFTCALFHRYDVSLNEELLLHITKSEVVTKSTLESLRGKCILFRDNERMVSSKHPLFSLIVYQDAKNHLKDCEMDEEEFQELQDNLYINLFDINRRLDQDEKGVVSYFLIIDVYKKISNSVINSIIRYCKEIISDDIVDEKARLNTAYSSTFCWGPLLGKLSEIATDPIKKELISLEEIHYRRALELKDDFTEAHNNYGLLLANTNRPEEAEVHYSRALELKEEYSKAHNNYGLLLANTGHPEEAEVHYQRALELREEDPEVHNNYGILLAETGRPKEAEMCFKRTLELKEEYPEAHCNYALFLANTGRPEDAKMHYKRALELREEFPEAHYNYAILFTNTGYPEDAKVHYKRALDLREEFPEAHCNYARLLADTSRFEEAEVHYKRALELREEDPEAHNNYGILLTGTDRSKEAEMHFKRTLELKEGYPEAHYNYATLLVDTGHNEDAGVHYKRALELREEFPDAHNNYALLLANAGHPEDAEVHYERALDLREEFPEAHCNYALLLSNTGRPEEAERHYKRAIEFRADFVQAYAGLGILYTDDSFFNINQAEIYWKKVVELTLNQGKPDVINKVLNILVDRQSKDKRLEPLVKELIDFIKTLANDGEGR